MTRQAIQEMVRLMQKAIGILEQDGPEKNSAMRVQAKRKSAKSTRVTSS
jgi:hypothetical protein